jgi:hypothetical protein
MLWVDGRPWGFSVNYHSAECPWSGRSVPRISPPWGDRLLRFLPLREVGYAGRLLLVLHTPHVEPIPRPTRSARGYGFSHLRVLGLRAVRWLRAVPKLGECRAVRWGVHHKRRSL